MFRKPIRDPKKITFTGLVGLVLAGLSNSYLHRLPNVSESWADGITGFLYGITIGALLLGVWLKSRGRTGTGSCA